MEDDQGEKKPRGKGRGSSFFAIGRDVWSKLLTINTTNRLNLITAYLVLLAGTGSDHRLTKWSAKACEDYAGMGKPRAKHAIEELICAGLVEHTDVSTRMTPQYRLPELPRDAEPIFLPVQIVTGLDNETPILRRIRETGDPLLLQMLIDLYGLVQLDATHGVPIGSLSEKVSGGLASRKISEVGVHAVWALKQGHARTASGDWATAHRIKAKDNTEAWRPFWERADTLKKIGAIWYEPWVFDGEENDAEPLMPVDPGVLYTHNPTDEESKLTLLAFEASRALIAERSYLIDQHGADIILPMAVHRRAPVLRGVARMRVEPDTPGRRLAWRKRRILIEQNQAALAQLIEDAEAFQFNRPMRLTSAGDR